MSERQPIGISRRDFLKVGTATVAAIVLGLTKINSVFAPVFASEANTPDDDLAATPESPTQSPTPTQERTREASPTPTPEQETILSSVSLSLNDRSPNQGLNYIFKKNILLSLAYLRGLINSGHDIDWDAVESPSQFKFTLQPKEVFAFHDQVLSQYTPVAITTKANFGPEQGFVWDNKRYGDGVCDLASLMYWAAKTAGLDQTYAPTKHSRAIPGIPEEYRVSILYEKGDPSQNLYIPNSFDRPVSFAFDYDGDNLRVSVIKEVRVFPSLQPEESELK